MERRQSALRSSVLNVGRVWRENLQAIGALLVGWAMCSLWGRQMRVQTSGCLWTSTFAARQDLQLGSMLPESTQCNNLVASTIFSRLLNRSVAYKAIKTLNGRMTA